MAQAGTAWSQTTFGAEGAQWHWNQEVKEATRLLYEDSERGTKWQNMVNQGVWPEAVGKLAHGEAAMARQRLLEMCKRKEGAVETEYLQQITKEEWEKYWKGKGRETSPGMSGTGPDLWKAAPEWFHNIARQVYSVVIRLAVFPEQWKNEVIVPVSKSGAASFVAADLRPIKLLEVSKKAVLSIVKERIRVDLETKHLLDLAQHGFRAGRSTHSAALLVLQLYEQARKNKVELHGVFLDIKKAYDTVEKGVGKGIALGRMGVGRSTINLFMTADRGNRNSFRHGWEELRKREGNPSETFEAIRGFPQGAAESPLLWIIFYDMVICQLKREGVGASVLTPGTYGQGATLG